MYNITSLGCRHWYLNDWLIDLNSKKQINRKQKREMVILIVATTIDPASINPANALLAMPGWKPGPFFQVSHLLSFIQQAPDQFDLHSYSNL